MATNTWNVLFAALTGSSELFLLCATGAYLCHKEILTRPVGQQLSRAILNAFLPALLFESILQTVHDLRSQKGQAFLVLVPPVCAMIVLTIGVTMGLFIMLLFGRGLHPMVKRACVMCVCFGNANTMPMLILRALCESFKPLQDAGGGVEMCKAKTTGFVSLFLIVWSSLFWSVGLRYIIGFHSNQSERDAGKEISNDSKHDVEEQYVLVDQSEHNDLEEERPSEDASSAEATKRQRPALFTPPVIAILVALCVGYAPGKTADLILRKEGPLQAFRLTLKLLGNTAIPMSSLLVGSKLFASRSARSSSHGTQGIGLKVIAAVVMARMVLMPAVGSITYIFTRKFLPTTDVIMHTILLAEFTTPSASNNVVMAQIASMYRPEVGAQVETTVATLIFWQYVVSPVLLTVNTSINLGAIFKVAAETMAKQVSTFS